MENNLKHAVFVKRLSKEWFYTLNWINIWNIVYFTLFVQLYVCLYYGISVIFNLGMNWEMAILLLYDMLVQPQAATICIGDYYPRDGETIAET